MAECIVCGAPTDDRAGRFCADHAPEDATLNVDEFDVSVIRKAPDRSGDRTTALEAPAQKPASRRPPGTSGRLVGRRLGGRFELRNFLGSGGFGSTYVAYDDRLRRDCVLKLLNPASDPPSRVELEMRRRFSNEAVALAHLVHPNVVQAFDHGTEPDGTCWIAMEYAKGKPLGDLLAEQRQLPVGRVAAMGQQIAAALAFAHGRGIVHRDLKPDNVILLDSATSGEMVKVLDFGIARITDPNALGLEKEEAKLTQAGAFFGTPAYMSPEQAEGQPVGPESDIYSLGVLLYRMLAGVLPGKVPEGWNPLTTLEYALSTPEPVRKLRPDCPAVLAELVHAMLVKDPRDRTTSAAQAQIELQQVLPTMAVAHAAVPRRRSPILVAFVAASVVALGATAAIVFLQSKPPPPAVDSQALLREQAITSLLKRARSGDAAVAIDGAALELLKAGSDPRLSLARGIAHRQAKDFAAALVYLDEAKALGSNGPVGTEAAALLAQTQADKEAAEAAERAAAVAAEKPAPAPEAAPAEPKPAKSPAKPKKAEEFPEY